jgi:D-serine deaminase-like pyridoxal phosphate-dependent protein
MGPCYSLPHNRAFAREESFMFEALATPSLLLDHDRLERNVRRMRERLAAKGVALRLHVKTAKNVEVARLAIGADTGPITVSTLAEAEYFIGHGFTDILYAVGIVPAKLARVAQLRTRGVDLKVVVDSVEAAQAAARADVPALIEIDSDGHRAGIVPGDVHLLEVARALGKSCAGVMTHAGDSYNTRSVDAIRAVAAREREAVVECARRIRDDGMDCKIVSVGSTPTATFGKSFEGVTEVRVGVYVFFDLVMAGLGVCDVDDIALSVLGSVIGHQRERNWIITDAGWMAMSRDRGTANHAVDQGYGLVCDANGKPLDDLIMVEANQEHGIIARRDGGPIDFARFPIGSLVRVLPNHACATGAQHKAYHVLRGGRLAATWDRIGGW